MSRPARPSPSAVAPEPQPEGPACREDAGDEAQCHTLRPAGPDDLAGLLQLYTQLHDNPLPAIDRRIEAIWRRLCGDDNHLILLGMASDVIVASCTLVIIENLTHGQRPYALIENVVTGAAYCRRGYGGALLREACRRAEERGCYKVMLMTSAKDDATLRFYRAAGFGSEDKTAFVRWFA